MDAVAGWQVVQAAGAQPGASRADLAKALGTDATGLLAALARLRELGFDISDDGEGVRIHRVPDRLLQETVVPLLPPDALGRAGWVHLERTASTNSEATRLALGGAAHGTVVVAEAQTAGRGRRGRAFASPAGCGLYASVVLRPEFPPAQAFRLTFSAAHAVADACEAWGLRPRLKWPNDVLVGGRKLCGILTEMSADAERIHHVVLGLGVNVNAADSDFPPEVQAVATSVRRETGAAVDRVAFSARVLAGLGAWYGQALVDFPAVLQRARERSDTLGKTVRVKDGGHELVGEAVDLDAEGALVLRTGNGTVRVVAGDVVAV